MPYLTKRKIKNPKTQAVKIKYYISYRDKSGKVIRISTGKSLKAEAQEVLNHFQKGTDANLFLSELIKEVLQFVKLNLESSYNLYEYALRMFLNITGNKSIKLITVSSIEQYKSVRLKSNVTGRNKLVSPRTVNKEVACIKAAFNKAAEMGLITSHKIGNARLLKIPQSNTRGSFTQAETDKILSNCSNAGLLKAVQIALNTGMRLNEIITLQVKDIDLNNRLIYIRNKSDIGFKTKTSQERIVPVNDDLFKLFHLWLGIQQNIISLNNENDFIVNYEGNRYRKDSISNKFRMLMKRLNLNGSFHTLRHTFASELISNGVDIQTVKELLGHSRIETTAIYMHSDNDRKFKAVSSLMKTKPF